MKNDAFTGFADGFKFGVYVKDKITCKQACVSMFFKK